MVARPPDPVFGLRGDEAALATVLEGARSLLKVLSVDGRPQQRRPSGCRDDLTDPTVVVQAGRGANLRREDVETALRTEGGSRFGRPRVEGVEIAHTIELPVNPEARPAAPRGAPQPMASRPEACKGLSAAAVMAYHPSKLGGPWRLARPPQSNTQPPAPGAHVSH